MIITKRHEQAAVALAKQAEIERREAVTSKEKADQLGYINTLRLATTEVDDHRFQRAERLLADVPPSLRGWEWRMLTSLASPRDVSRWKIGPFADRVHRLVFSPDGKRIAMATAASTTRVTKDPKIVVADTTSGTFVSVMRGHTDGVFGLAFTPDGQQILSGGRDQTLRR